MLETLHKGKILLNIAFTSGIAGKPLAEREVQGLVLGFGNFASTLNEVFVGAECNILHEISVHEYRVQRQTQLYWHLGAVYADRREQAAGVYAFFAVAEEKVGVACGAQIACENILFAQARGQEL